MAGTSGSFDRGAAPGVRLVITIEAMQVLPADRLEPVLLWLTGLPSPWCPAETILETAPAMPDLAPIVSYVGRRKPGQR